MKFHFAINNGWFAIYWNTRMWKHPFHKLFWETEMTFNLFKIIQYHNCWGSRQRYIEFKILGMSIVQRGDLEGAPWNWFGATNSLKEK